MRADMDSLCDQGFGLRFGGLCHPNLPGAWFALHGGVDAVDESDWKKMHT